MVTLPVYLSTNGTSPQDVQILAVAARLAEFLVNNDTRFHNATSGNSVKINVDIRYGTFLEHQSCFTGAPLFRDLLVDHCFVGLF